MTASAVLVTGGAGYIGSHAVWALLDRGERVVVIDNLSTGSRKAVPPGVTFSEGDVSDGPLVERLISENAVGAVMHFAGSISVPESVTDPIKYYRNNTAASISLISACVTSKIAHFIFSSSAAVYGTPETSPVGEDSPTRPISPYGASKLMTEAMLTDVSVANPQFRPVSLRYFNVAGADPAGRTGQRNPESTGLIPLALAAMAGSRPALDICGDDYPTRDGTGERDYIHVADLASAHLAALDYLRSGGAPTIMNLGYGRGATVLEVVATLEKISGRSLPTRRALRRPGDAGSVISDISRMRGTLDWRPQHDDLGEILRSALAWRECEARNAPP